MNASSLIIEHQTYLRGMSDLRTAIQNSLPGNIVWLIAPSGSGKSEIRYSLMRELSGSPTSWLPGHLPAISVRALLTDRLKFNPKDFALRLALSLRRPNLKWLMPRGSIDDPDIVHLQNEVLAASEQWNLLKLSKSEHELREEFERSAPLRGVKWIFIEEVASFLQIHKNQSSRNYMLGLMQLAEEIGCILVMCGTHLAEDLWVGNQEVLNRSAWVWIHRYDERNPDHLRPFAEMVKSMSGRLRLDGKDLLVNNLDLLLLNGAGIFGSTYQYLKRSENAREADGAPCISIDHLRSASSTGDEQISLWNYARAFDAVSKRTPNIDLSLVARPVWVDEHEA